VPATSCSAGLVVCLEQLPGNNQCLPVPDSVGVHALCPAPAFTRPIPLCPRLQVNVGECVVEDLDDKGNVRTPATPIPANPQDKSHLMIRIRHKVGIISNPGLSKFRAAQHLQCSHLHSLAQPLPAQLSTLHT
jgi:hypothetical protein